jgi:putative membrane protein insertion efficiency factor
MSGVITRVLIAPIRWYQRLISPLRPQTCRFHPSCSAYAVTALEVHGPIVGTWLAMRRLGRCHPWTPGGVDHVPPRGQWRSIRPPYDPRADGPGGGHAHDDGADGSNGGTTGAPTATRSRGLARRPSSLTSAFATPRLALTFVTTARRPSGA